MPGSAAGLALALLVTFYELSRYRQATVVRPEKD